MLQQYITSGFNIFNSYIEHVIQAFSTCDITIFMMFYCYVHIQWYTKYITILCHCNTCVIFKNVDIYMYPLY